MSINQTSLLNVKVEQLYHGSLKKRLKNLVLCCSAITNADKMRIGRAEEPSKF